MSLPAINIKLAADLTDFLKSMDLAQRTFKKVGDNMMEMGKTMSTYVTAPLAGLAAVSLKAAGDMEALKNGLASVTKAGESVNKEMTKLREVAKLPGLGLKEVVQGSINLQAIGVSADDARKAMLAFGNAIASVGGGKDNFDLAIRGFSQLRNAAKPLQQDLYQIANQLPQVNSLLIEAFGTSRAEDLAAMGISGKQLADFLVEGLGKLPKVTGGINNAFENLKDTGFAALATLGDAINKNFGVSELLDKIANAIGRMVSAFENLDGPSQKMVLMFGTLAAVAGPLIATLGFFVSNILPALKTGLNALMGTFSLVNTTIAGTVAALAILAYSARLIVANWELVSTFWTRMWLQMKLDMVKFTIALETMDWDALRRGAWYAMKSTWEAFVFWLEKIWDAWVWLTKPITSLIDGVVDSTTKSFKKAVANINSETAKIKPIETNETVDNLRKLQKEIEKSLAATPVVTFSQVITGFKETAKSDLNNLMTWFNGTGKEAEKMGQKVQNALGKANGGGGGGGFKFKKLSSDGTIAPTEVKDPKVKGESMDNDNDMQMMATGTEAMAARIAAAMQSISASIAQAKADMIVNFAEMLGAAITTGSGFDAMPKMIFDTFANLLTQLGKIAISTGIGIAAINKAFQSLNPVVAIAAGVGLIALGAVIRSSVKNMGGGGTAVPKYAKGGLAYGPTIGMIGDNPNAHIDPEVVAPLSKLKGMIGGNNQAVQVVGNFRVQGPDLLLAIKNAEMRERGNS